MIEVKYVHFKGKVIKLIKDGKGIFRDEKGTRWGYTDSTWSVDSDTRLGVGPLSFPLNDPANIAARFHDAAYSDPAYEESNNRSTADEMLFKQLKQLPGWRSFLAYPFWAISRLAGGIFWEVKQTRDK